MGKILQNIFTSKESKKDKNKKANIVPNILNMLGFNGFGHEENFINWVAENNANLFNAPIKTNYSTVDNYLVNNEYYRKNWVSLYRRSKFGASGYLTFSYENNLFFQPVNITNRKYDVTGKLIEVTVFYEPYEKNSIEVIFFETYTLTNKNTIKIERAIYKMRNGKKDGLVDNFKDFNNNNKLKETQNLNLSYLPIVPMRNKPNEEPDCALVGDKIKMLDIFFEQILVDVLVNSPKFIFENVYGNTQDQIEDAVKKLLFRNYLFTNNGKPVDVLEGQYKGKALTDVIDWLINEISKRIFLYIPSQKKSAQQTKGEAESVNIGTINAVEQKLMLYKIDTLNFIKTLIKFDNDLLNGKTFNLKANDSENLTIEMNVINPANNQLEDEEVSNGKRQNNLSETIRTEITTST